MSPLQERQMTCTGATNVHSIAIEGSFDDAQRVLKVILANKTFAAEHRLPAIYQATLFAEAGGLMSWAPDLENQYKMAAQYVDKILRGANPGDLPFEIGIHRGNGLPRGTASTQQQQQRGARARNFHGVRRRATGDDEVERLAKTKQSSKGHVV